MMRIDPERLASENNRALSKLGFETPQCLPTLEPLQELQAPKMLSVACLGFEQAILNNHERKNMRKAKRIVGLLLVLGAFGYFIFLGSGRPFNSEHWKAWVETEAECCTRWEMVSSLTRKHSLVGMHRSEIIELLGKPDHESHAELYYYLGMARHGIDTGSLRLVLDQNGSVEYHEVSRD